MLSSVCVCFVGFELRAVGCSDNLTQTMRVTARHQVSIDDVIDSSSIFATRRTLFYCPLGRKQILHQRLFDDCNECYNDNNDRYTKITPSIVDEFYVRLPASWKSVLFCSDEHFANNQLSRTLIDWLATKQNVTVTIPNCAYVGLHPPPPASG